MPQACATRSGFSALVREGAHMLSRTADHLFWMARYTERAERPCAAGLSKKYGKRVQHARGSLPSSKKEITC
ncbi:alpha-E domain-containing protein [Acidovorax sp. KKS102]|uniref:alpha-E domain-containing protein n=1 Tax=Acidovorax sp. KKS102 TaxID=358220 RepID=UPI0011D2ADFA